MPRLKSSKIEVGVDDLLLDLENPRTGSVAGQSEALEAVIRLNTQHFKNMMASIKENDLDPGDSFYVIADDSDDDSFIVVDGNRRLAALQVLGNPDLLQGTALGDSIKKRLQEQSAGYAPVEPVSCVLFESRADANEWIERRHGKGLEGEGRISWGTLESERFQRDRTVLDVIGFVERNSTLEDADWQRVKKSVEKSPTTLRRFIVSKPGRQALGWVDQEGENGPAFKRDPAYVIKVLSHLFGDIDSGEVTSRTYNTATEIKEYFDSLPKGLEPSKQKETAANPFSTTDIKDSVKRPRLAAKVAPVVVVKTKKISPPRLTLAPTKHQFAEPDGEKGKQLVREASKLKLKDTPLGCAFLFRALLEYSFETEMRTSSISDKDGKGNTVELSVRFERVYQHLTTTAGRVAKKSDLTAIRTILTAKHGHMSFGALNGYIHDRFQKPSPDDLRNAWDSAVPLFVAIYGAHK